MSVPRRSEEETIRSPLCATFQKTMHLQTICLVSLSLSLSPQVVFTQPCGPTPQSSARHYKVFVKVEEAKKKKRSEVIWTVSSAESARKESTLLHLGTSIPHAPLEATNGKYITMAVTVSLQIAP